MTVSKAIAAAGALLLAAVASRADVVVLKNGDRLTGEIQKLEESRLSLKTGYAGTIKIEWEMVDEILADRRFRVETQNGSRWTGSLKNAGAGYQVVSADTSLVLTAEDIVGLAPAPSEAGGGFLGRIQGHIDFGYSLTRGNSPLNQSTAGLNAQYRGDAFKVELGITSLFSRQSNAPTASDHSASLRVDRYLGARAFAFGLSEFLRDDRQLLNLRTNLGGGLGWRILNTDRTGLAVLGGFTYVNEDFREREATAPQRRSSSGEGLLSLDLDKATLGRMRFTSKVALHPNLVETGRYRLTMESGLQIPLVSHFTWGLRLFDRFDSRPPIEVLRNDYGLLSTFGVTF